MSVTIQAQSFINWRYADTTAPTLYLYATQNFKSSDGNLHTAGNHEEKESWCYAVPCTIVSNELRVPSFVIDSIEDSDNPNARYVAVLVQSNQIRRFFLENFRMPDFVAGTATWAEIRTFNETAPMIANDNAATLFANFITLAGLTTQIADAMETSVHRLASVVWDLSGVSKTLFTVPTGKTAVISFFIIRGKSGNPSGSMSGKLLTITNSQFANVITQDYWENFLIADGNGYNPIWVDKDSQNYIIGAGQAIEAVNSASGTGEVYVDVFGFFV